MSRYLDPKSDIVFKKIFGQHPHLLREGLALEEIAALTELPLTTVQTLKYGTGNSCWSDFQ